MASNEISSENYLNSELSGDKGSSQNQMPNGRGKKKLYLTDVVDMIGNLTTEITKLTGEISGLKSETESLKETIVEIKKTNIDTCTRICTLDGDLTELRLENAKLRSINEDLESRIILLEYHQSETTYCLKDYKKNMVMYSDVQCFNKVCEVI